MMRARDATGLRHLLEDHGGVVLARLRRVFSRFLSALEIDEAMSNAVIKIWAAAPRLRRHDSSLRAWLFVTARHCGLTIFRLRRHGDQQIDGLEEILIYLAASTSEEIRLRRIADFHGCLRELPELQRAVIQADLDADGMAATDLLAERLLTTSHAIHRARHRGRAELRRMMQRLGHFVDAPAPLTSPELRTEPELG